MAVFVNTARTVEMGSAWTGTAPGSPGTQTISGTINSGTDFSAYVDTGAETTWNADMVETTNMASGGFRAFIAGLKSGDDITIPFQGDVTASGLLDDLQTVFGSLVVGGSAYIDIKADDAARGTSNPSFVAEVIAQSFQPIGAGVGDLARMGLTLKVTGAFAELTS